MSEAIVSLTPKTLSQEEHNFVKQSQKEFTHERTEQYLLPDEIVGAAILTVF